MTSSPRLALPGEKNAVLCHAHLYYVWWSPGESGVGTAKTSAQKQRRGGAFTHFQWEHALY